MRHKNRAGQQCLRFSVILIIFTFTIAGIAQINIRSDNQQGQENVTRTTSPKRQAQATSTDTMQPNHSRDKNKKLKSRKQEAKRPRGLNDEASVSSRDAKKQQAISLLEGVLATTDRITPVEYRILTEVEAATLLWQLDKERSISVLKNAVERMRRILEKEKQSDTEDRADNMKRQRINFIILRKIAALKPDLIKDLSLESSSEDKPGETIKDEWTDEARAIMSVAYDQIEKDPKLAARLAQQSLSFGFVDWLSFLERLRKRDPKEAEQLAIALMDLLRNSTLSAAALQSLQNFVFASNDSPGLQEHFFQSLVIRLRRDIRLDISAQEMESDLLTAREMVQSSASFPRWQPQFENILYAFEALFSERALPVPGPPRRKMLDVSTISAATPGETGAISGALARVGAIRDSQMRDREYQKLTAKASLSADMGLAMEILSKINDEAIRRETTLLIYGPIVRRHIEDGDWSQAQKQALNIQDPLGRTLALDKIAQAMSSSKDKSQVKEVYGVAVAQLARESSTEEVAKAFLIVAKSLYPLDLEAGLDAMKSAVSALNKITIKEESLGHSTISSGLEAWVRLPNYSLRPDEVLDITDMVGSEFEDIARRDTEKALLIADGLTHRGLYSLAHLAISRVLLEQINKSPLETQRKKTATT